jgi:uncharacterized protein
LPSQRYAIELSDPGTPPAVTAQVWPGAGDGAVVILAHGAGSRIDHPVHQAVCAAIAETGAAVVGFNFVYSEAGRRSPDRRERLLSCYRDVADWVAERFPGRPLAAGGRSMGGRMASLLAADGYPFAGLVLLNYPLIGIRGDGPPRVDHWPEIEVPVLFVHGTRDRLFPLSLFEQHRHLLTVPVTAHVVDDADHSFAVPKRAGRAAGEVYAEVAGAVARWLPTAVAA